MVLEFTRCMRLQLIGHFTPHSSDPDAMEYLKKAAKSASTGEQDVRATVQNMLDEIEKGGEAVVQSYATKLDKWQGDIVVSEDQRKAAH